MATILNTQSIYYNDCNLIAQRGSVISRANIPRELNRIIVSPMMAVVGEKFAKESARLGLTVCLHRFGSRESQREIYEAIDHDYGNKYNTQNIYCSVGMDDIDRVRYLTAFSSPDKWCLDIANGYLPQIKEKLQVLFKDISVKSLIIGNIHTLDGFYYLSEICKDLGIPEVIVRTGIAGGAPCSTSDVVGVNRGNITEIMECYEGFKNYSHNSFKPYICADGGIKKSSYACKAFAAGGSYTMMGGYFMNAIEAESNLNGDGSYWGGASHKQQILTSGKITRHSEGKEIKEDRKLVPLKDLVDDLWWGISSYISYSGYSTLSEAIGKGVFEIKANSLPPKNRI